MVKNEIRDTILLDVQLLVLGLVHIKCCSRAQHVTVIVFWSEFS